jgi:hypothetical protein
MLRNRDKEAAEFLRAIHKKTCDLIKRSTEEMSIGASMADI